MSRSQKKNLKRVRKKCQKNSSLKATMTRIRYSSHHPKKRTPFSLPPMKNRCQNLTMGRNKRNKRKMKKRGKRRKVVKMRCLRSCHHPNTEMMNRR